MAEWVRRKANPDTLEASASAQLMALRNEVYALRVEVAAVAQALPPPTPPGASERDSRSLVGAPG